VIARFEKSSYAKRADRVVIRHGRGKVVAIIGIHKAIWDEFTDEPFEAPPGRSLTVASYIGGDLPTAYVESVRIGDLLPSQPIFLSADRYVPAPLEATYEQAWKVFPSLLKQLVEPSAG